MNLHDYTASSPAWDSGEPEIIRFITPETEYGLPWHSLGLAQFLPNHNSILLHYGAGSIVIKGDATPSLWINFTNRKVIAVRIHLPLITSISIELR